MMDYLKSSEDLIELIAREKALCCYFTRPACAVGESLESKVESLLSTTFPKIRLVGVDMNVHQRDSESLNVFVEPTVIFFFEGKEYIRKTRNFSLVQLEPEISRIYALVF